MKVSGFTFIRNAIKYDYPIIEAIQSILPLCDEVIVAVGESEDNTWTLLTQLSQQYPTVKLIPTRWDDTLRAGGQVLALETNKAFAAIAKDADWAFYIQGDEILHEKHIPTIQKALHQYCDDTTVDGLLFNYLHFYGSYDYIATANKWYTHEIRIIKNNPTIYSYKDAQGFRKENNKKLDVKAIDAYMHHYGWVKPPATMQRKQEDFNKLWHSDEWVNKNVVQATEFDYSNIDSLQQFEDTHPKVMQQRIRQLNWQFDHDISTNKTKLKDRLKQVAKNKLGLDFSYKNYNLI